MAAGSHEPGYSEPAPAGLYEAGNRSAQRKRLAFRCWHRGTREADLLLGRFASAYLDSLSEAQLDELDMLLGYSDPDLYNWITGREAVPADVACSVLRLLQASQQELIGSR